MKMRIPTNKEYDRLVALTDGADYKMHWEGMLSWVDDAGAKHSGPSYRAVRGWVSARSWDRDNATDGDVLVGFRPAVETLGPGALGPDIQKRNPCVIGTLYMDGQPVKVPTNPTTTGDVTAYVPGAKLEMREALDDRVFERVNNL